MTANSKNPIVRERINHLEGIINTAHLKGLFQRFPKRFKTAPNVKEELEYHCEQLTVLNVPLETQAKALEYVKTIDQQTVWEALYKRSFLDIATEILEGGA